LGIQTIADIAKILKERRDLKAKEGIIIWMFMRYLESLGFERGKDFEIESNLNNVEVDLVIYDMNRKPVVIIDVIEPSSFGNLQDQNFITLIERVLVRSYIYALNPKYIVITNGFSLLVYNEKGVMIDELSTSDLSSVDSNFEIRFREILLRWDSKIKA